MVEPPKNGIYFEVTLYASKAALGIAHGVASQQDAVGGVLQPALYGPPNAGECGLQGAPGNLQELSVVGSRLDDGTDLLVEGGRDEVFRRGNSVGEYPLAEKPKVLLP